MATLAPLSVHRRSPSRKSHASRLSRGEDGRALAPSMSNATFCDLDRFAAGYKQVHGFLSLLVCVFGSVANVLNICVLSSKEMRWPTNLILTGLAVADLLVMLEYIPFSYHRYLDARKHISKYSYNWAVFMFFHALFSQVCHFISCCLTVILAIWRYITITSPRNGRVWCSIRRTMYIIVATYVVCPLICCPLFVSLKIKAHNQTSDRDGNIIDKKDLGLFKARGVEVVEMTIYYTSYNNNEVVKFISFLIYGVVFKLVPCVLLTYLSWCLIAVLLDTKKRRQLLLNSSLPLKAVNAVKPLVKKPDKDKQAERTSTMLLAVLILFLITEFPQAILGLLSVIIGPTFERQCYLPLGDVMDILALTNSAINFILYCTMSRQFRTTFSEFFRVKLFNNWIPLTQHSSAEKTQLSQV